MHLMTLSESERSLPHSNSSLEAELEAGTMPKRRQGTLQEDSVSEEKRVRFADQNEEWGENDEEKSSKNSRFKAKHSLDSDEEDEVKESTLLDEEEIEGQEDSTVTYEEGVCITPFNLKSEMEEGYFDSDGNYFEKADPDKVEDTWLEGVDWDRVEEMQSLYEEKAQLEESQEEEEVADKTALLQQIVLLLRPGETVLKALRRLGGGSKSASERWKSAKKLKAEQPAAEAGGSRAAEPAAKGDLDRLTSLADTLLSMGEFGIYEDTYEGITFRISQEAESHDEDDDLDRFGHALDSGQDLSAVDTKSASDEVQWEFKWENTTGAALYGPFGTQQMADWKEQGYFKGGVWARRCGGSTDTPYYNTQRIDFDLYL